jgi:hypothetical protein
MDVLAYWSPTIDWSRFTQGHISDPMWRSFKDLVQLCHCAEHWRELARSQRFNTRPPTPIHKESPYMRRKRRDEWERPIREMESHFHRAAHLADEKVAEMSYLISAADEGKPDWKLWWAVSLSIDRSFGHTGARYKTVALDEFDAAAELTDVNPSHITGRLLARAGYSL